MILRNTKGQTVLAVLACCLCLAHLPAATAQTSAEQAEPDTTASVKALAPTLIEEIRFPATVNFPRLALGQAAFDANRKLAPEAKLSFRFVDLASYSTPLTIRWESGDKSTPLEPDKEGKLSLSDPTAMGDKDAVLVMNRRINEVRVEPAVLSPGMPPNVQRMGDLRLHCEVLWAMEKGGKSAATRALYWMLGSPCKSKSAAVITLQSTPTDPLETVEIAQGQRTLSLQANATRTGFVVPIYDKSWGDDATVRITIGKPPTAAPTEAQPSL